MVSRAGTPTPQRRATSLPQPRACTRHYLFPWPNATPAAIATITIATTTITTHSREGAAVVVLARDDLETLELIRTDHLAQPHRQLRRHAQHQLLFNCVALDQIHWMAAAAVAAVAAVAE